MPWHEDITGALPPPEGEYQRDLRRDIIDELVDHLECATRRELRHTDDLDAARRAVLRRFGNPRRIACRLWFDALKESIMSQRVSLITNVVLAVVCIALAVFVFVTIRQGERRMAMFLAEMRMLREQQQHQAGEVAAPVLAEAVVTVRRGSVDGPPVADCEVELEGSPFDPGSLKRLQATTLPDGTATFGPIPPGDYLLHLITTELDYTETIVLYAGRNEVGPIVKPALSADSIDVSFEVTMPEPLEERVRYLGLIFEKTPQNADAAASGWHWSSTWLLMDPSGHAMQVKIDDNPYAGDPGGPTKPAGMSYLSPEKTRLQPAVALNSTFKYRLLTVVLYLVRTTDEAARGVYRPIELGQHLARPLGGEWRREFSQPRPWEEPERYAIQPQLEEWMQGLQPYRPGEADSSVWKIKIPEWFAEYALAELEKSSTSE